MSTYALTKARIFQYIGILLVLAFVAAGYWYFAVRAGVKTNSGAVQPQGTDDLSAGLAAYFKLDENTGTSAADSSTNAVTAGTLTNGPTWTTGRIGSAVDFDGTNDYITVSDNDALDLGDTDDMTLTGWFNRDTFTTYDFIMAKYDGVNPGYRVYIDDSADNLHFTLYDGTDQYDIDGFNVAFTTSGWHHFAVVWDQDSPEASEIYVDGVDIDATDGGTIGSIGSITNSLAFSIGEEIGYGQPFDGKLDEIRIYDRVLSPDNIAKLYQTTVPTGVDTSLKGYWSFDGGALSGTMAYDRSGAGNNGTLTNGPTVAEGRVGQALNLDGTDDYVNAGSAASIDNLTDLSTCAWVNPDTIDTTPNAYSGIIGQADNGGAESTLELYDDGTDDYIVFWRTFSTTAGVWRSLPNILPIGSWSHICVTYNNSSTTNDPVMYLNGAVISVVETQTPVGSASSTAGGDYYIGAFDNGASGADFFDGKIDEARIYNRILSAAEIKSLYDRSQSDKTNTSASQPQGTGNLNSGLAGYWKLDENTGTSAADASTNSNTGTLTNGPTWTTGQIGSGVAFDGTNDYIELGDSNTFEPGLNLTISAWIYPTAAGVHPGIVVKSASYNEASAKYAFYLYSSSRQLGFAMGGTIRTSSLVVPLNQWSFVAVSQNNAGMTFYLNGQTYSAGVAALPSYSTETLNIGSWASSASPATFTGSIDEVRLYNRGLSVDELANLYRLTTPTGVDTSLKGYWSFNGQDISGTTAFDRSGAGNTGTLTNGPTIARGKLGQALDFDGVNDYVDAGSAAILDDLTQKTVCQWIYPETIPVTWSMIVSKNDGSGWDTELNSNSGNNRFEYYQPQSGTAGSWKSPVDSVPFFTWTHVCVSYDNSSLTNDPVMYINGLSVPVEELQTPTGTFSPDASAPLRIGAWAGAGELYDGKIDEVRIYNRLLPATEVKSLYDQSAPDKTNTSASQPQGTGNLDSGLAGYWKLDENTGTSAADTSTVGTTGILTNGPTWTTGRIGSAVDFDGTNDYIATGDIDSTDGASALTITAWVYPDTLPANATVVSKNNSSAGWEVTVNSGSVILFDSGANCYITTTTSLVAAQWQHIAAVFDGALAGNNRYKIYVDGAGVASTPSGSCPPAATTSNTANVVAIGASPLGTALWDGKLDEVRLYNRALSADETAQLYRLGTPTGTDTSLKGYWSFNGQDMSGTTAYDRSGAGNNGTLVNGPAVARGKLGQALSFDGTDDYVNAGSAASLDAIVNLTACAWVRQDTFLTWAAIVTKNYWELQFANSTSQIEFARTFSGNNGNWRTEGSIPVGTWGHVCVAYDDSSAANDPSIYINGVLQPLSEWNTPAGTASDDSASNLVMGQWTGGGNDPLDGQLDEVRVYNRILSAAEVLALYNQSR